MDAAAIIDTLTPLVPGASFEAVPSVDFATMYVPADRLLATGKVLRDAPSLRFNVLIEITAADYLPRAPRFEVVYHLLSIPHKQRLRLKVRVGADDPIPTVQEIWPGAGWPEREVWDMFGIIFDGHPDLRRLLMPEDWEGHPARKDYPVQIRKAAQTYEPLQVSEEEFRANIQRDRVNEIPLMAELRSETMTVNMGPQHPSTHGVLRLVLELDGEVIQSVMPTIGYLHTGIEKTAEQKKWQQVIPLVERMDYLGAQSNSLAYALAVEKLLGLEMPQRVNDIRVLIAELQRLSSHLIWLGTHGMEIGAVSMLFYAVRERELLLNINELIAGFRFFPSYIRIGGLREDLPRGFHPTVDEFLQRFPGKIDEFEGLLTKNDIFRRRTEGVGVVTQEDAFAWGLVGPIARAAGSDYDVRKYFPYLGYETYDFKVPTATEGDVYARYRVRVAEMRESVKIAKQALDRISPTGVWACDDPRVVPPPKDKVYSEMEALIQHFLIYSQGFTVPAGESYFPIEGPRGEHGTYIVSDGTNRPWRVKMRAPSFMAIQALPRIVQGGLIADVVSVIGSTDVVMGDCDR